MASLAQLHAELIGFLRQHCSIRDQCHLVLVGWMMAGLLLSETVCFVANVAESVTGAYCRDPSFATGLGFASPAWGINFYALTAYQKVRSPLRGHLRPWCHCIKTRPRPGPPEDQPRSMSLCNAVLVRQRRNGRASIRFAPLPFAQIRSRAFLN